MSVLDISLDITYADTEKKTNRMYTQHFINAAMQGLERIFKKGYGYKKAGIVLNDISDAGMVLQDLFMQLPKHNDNLMIVLDQINDKFGKGTLRSAQEGFGDEWVMKSEIKSPAYTTRFSDVIHVS